MTKKSFKEYLLESKQTYEFKIKIAGELEECCPGKIKQALQKYKVESMSEVRRTPIQETVSEFPEHKNVEINIFDISLTYPVTSYQVRDLVAEALNKTHSCISVKNVKEQEEEQINAQYDPNEKSGESLLTQPYEKTNNQSVVGEKQVMSLLKDLNKEKHQGTQYKGVNDQLLAKKAPSSKDGSVKTKTEKSMSPIGSREITKPDPYKGR